MDARIAGKVNKACNDILADPTIHKAALSFVRYTEAEEVEKAKAFRDAVQGRMGPGWDVLWSEKRELLWILKLDVELFRSY